MADDLKLSKWNREIVVTGVYNSTSGLSITNEGVNSSVGAFIDLLNLLLKDEIEEIKCVTRKINEPK